MMRRLMPRAWAWRQRLRLHWWGRLANRVGGACMLGPMTMTIHAKGLTLAWYDRILWRGEITEPPEA